MKAYSFVKDGELLDDEHGCTEFKMLPETAEMIAQAFQAQVKELPGRRSTSRVHQPSTPALRDAQVKRTPRAA